MVLEDFRFVSVVPASLPVAAMRDRTRELRQGSDSESDSEGGEGRLRPRPPGGPALKQAGAVRADLRALGLKVAELEQLQELVLGTPIPSHELQQDLQRLRDETQELTRNIQRGLKALEAPETENRNSIQARVRRTQHGLLAQQLWAVTGRLQDSQGRYRQRSLDRIRRQLQIAGSPPVSEEELEQMLETGQSEIFVSNLLLSARAARGALDEVGERQRDLQRLERGLRELRELFLLLGGTVETQGELLDRVERHLQDSGARLEKGRGQLGHAQRRRRAGRKRRLALAACASVAILVLVAIVAASVAAG